MSKIITKNTFVNAISPNDNAYQKFYNNYLSVYKEFFVEGDDDPQFYRYYLSQIYHHPDLLKFHVCNGKDEVLRESSKYIGKKARFIVDLDYKLIDKNKYNKIVITSGYSFENFFFFKDKEKYNFYKIFELCYPDCNIRQHKIEKYINVLIDFKDNYGNYYAFFKTCMEFSNKYKTYDNHVRIKEKITITDDLEKEIDQEIENINLVNRNKFKQKYEANKKIINESEYMLIRGHDILDTLINFLKDDGINISKYDILNMSNGMIIPNEFIDQLTNEY